MKTLMILIALVVCGCASEPTELAQEELDLHVFYEEPKIEYEDLGRIDTTNRGKNAMDVLDKVLRRAAELGADGVIVHSIQNRGADVSRGDSFGTGGGSRTAVFRIEATAIRYIE